MITHNTSIIAKIHHNRQISKFGVATAAHPNDAMCIGIRIFIIIQSIEMEIFIPTQNTLFEYTVKQLRTRLLQYWHLT